MQKLIDFVLKYKEYIIFVALVVISLSFISMGDVSKIGGFRTALVGGVGVIQRMFAWVPNPAALKSENQALRDLNLQLSSEVTKMRKALVENENLRQMLQLKEKKDYNYVAADVIGRTTVEMRSYFTLSNPGDKEICEGMAVRNDAGLVGLVVGVTSNYILVESIRNRDVKIAIRDERSGIDGILVWDGSQDFNLKNIPKSYDVKDGDLLLTSNLSSRYPANIPVGRIKKVSDAAGDLFMKIVVTPTADLNTLEQVFVVKNVPNPEIRNLIEQIDAKLRARKSISTRK